VTAYLRDFVAHKCCQQLLSDLWIGGMNVRKYLKWMVLLALFFPPALLLIDFKSSKELQLMPQTEEEYFQSTHAIDTCSVQYDILHCLLRILDEEDLVDSDNNCDDSTDDSSGTSRSSSDDESPEPILPGVPIDRDDEPIADDMLHETNTLRKRKRKHRKKKRKKQNSSTFHGDDSATSPVLNSSNRSDDLNLRVLNELPCNHQSSPPTAITTISLDDQDASDHNHDVVYTPDQTRSIRSCCRNLFERFHHSIVYRFICIFLRQTRKCFRRYRCCKKMDRDNYSNENADQIPLTKKIYEFYNAPVTKFFQDLIFYMIFLGMFTYVVLIRTPPKPSVCEWLLMSYLTTVAMDLIRELLMMNETRWKTWLSVYFHDVLHIYDTCCCLMFALAFVLRLTAGARIVGRLLLCINLSLWYLRMFHFLVVSKEVGPYIHIAARNVSDVHTTLEYLDNCDRTHVEIRFTFFVST
jgi:hypothetical protein